MATPNRVLLDVSRGGPGADVLGARLKAQGLRLLRRVPLEGVELSLTLVRDAEIRRLNREWRKKDKPTDVLSFPGGDMPGPGRRVLGDVIISVDTAKRQAREFGVPLPDELRHYLAHGLLHLLGHDHHVAREARVMEAEERRLLGRGGMLARSDEVD